MKYKFLGFCVLSMLLMFFSLNLILLISGFAIVNDYYSGKPLIMAPNETRDIQFGRLQNVGEEDIIYEVSIVGGSEIAEITDSSLTYTVLAGNTNTPINMRVFIPKKAKNNTEYTITVRFLDITPSEDEGMITLATSSVKSIPVLVQGEEFGIWAKVKKINIWWIVLGILSLMLLVVIYILIRMRRENEYK